MDGWKDASVVDELVRSEHVASQLNGAEHRGNPKFLLKAEASWQSTRQPFEVAPTCLVALQKHHVSEHASLGKVHQRPPRQEKIAPAT